MELWSESRRYKMPAASYFATQRSFSEGWRVVRYPVETSQKKADFPYGERTVSSDFV